MPRSREMIHIPVRTPAELTQRWADLLLEPPTFGRRSLWLAWVGDNGVMPPILAPIDDIPARPDRRMVEGLLAIHAGIVEEVGTVAHLALALSRPGSPRPTADDERWADALRTTLTARIAETWSLHLAAEGEVNPLVDPPWERSC
jgi:hypothetical protein